jgi:proteic killer suppression protein
MILGYRDKRTRELAAGKRVKAFSGFRRAAELRLDRLDAATSLADLAALPGKGLRHSAETEKDSTGFASMTNGGSVSNGRKAAPGRSTSRLLTTTRE